MLKPIMLATVAFCGLGLAATAQDAADPAPAEVTRDSVVASVNGTDITLGELIAATASLPPEYQQLPPEYLFDGVLQQLIQQQLLAETVTDIPARVGISLRNEERSLLAGEAVTEFMAGAVTDEQIQAAYDAQFNAETAQTEFHAAHILVATEDEAQAVLDRLDAGEDFAAIAQEVSTDTGSGANGGDLGWFTAEMMVEPFGSTVAGMEPGSVTGPVETQFGWHIIRLDESRQQELPPFEMVRGQIAGDLQQAAIEAYLAELETAAAVTRPEPGAFDPAVVTDLGLLAN